MPAARVEYIAPWWVVWLHSVPHLGLRLQRVDSTFNPRDENYQEVSRAATDPGHPFLLPSPPLSASLSDLPLHRSPYSSPRFPFPPGPSDLGPPIWKPRAPGS